MITARVCPVVGACSDEEEEKEEEEEIPARRAGSGWDQRQPCLCPSVPKAASASQLRWDNLVRMCRSILPFPCAAAQCMVDDVYIIFIYSLNHGTVITRRQGTKRFKSFHTVADNFQR
eukprot:COSAG01_NODE_9482_length_2435_cov_1.681079_3_plen_118_part_00